MNEIPEDDPRVGGGSLLQKLAHADARANRAETRAVGLETQLHQQAEIYRATIAKLQERVTTLENTADQMAVEQQFFQPDGPPARLPASELCVVELCGNVSIRGGYCGEHAWILDQVD